MSHALAHQEAVVGTSSEGARSVQRSSSESMRGSLRGMGVDAQQAALTPVQQRRAPGGQRAGDPVQMHVGSSRTRNIQRLETPNQGTTTPNTSATPHADAALAHVNANGIETGTEGANAPQLSVPQTYEDYVAHIRTTFAAELEEVRVLKEQQKQKGGEAQAKEAKLELDAQELNWYQHELETMGRSIDELSKIQQIRHDTLEAIKGYQGKTMAQLHEAMEALLKTYEGKLGNLSESEAAQVEAIMYASIELGGQVNPEASGKVRLLYLDKIDNGENPRLVRVAESEGLALDKLAEMGVKYRTWSKTFVRTELMDDKQAAEILFMRDLGADGNQIGVTPEGLAKKLFKRAQEKAKVPADKIIPFDQASQQQQMETYKAMLAKAKETNPNVNAALTAPRMQRPLGLPDDQPSPTPGGNTDTNTNGTGG